MTKIFALFSRLTEIVRAVLLAALFATIGLPGANAQVRSTDEVERVLSAGVETGVRCGDPAVLLEDAAWHLAVTASAEGRSEGVAGMALIVESAVNRLCADKKAYGGSTSAAVVLHPWAFSVYNADSPVRAELIRLMNDRKARETEIKKWAEVIYPIALRALQGWRTGLLPGGHGCRHYKTTWAKAKWAQRPPDLVFGRHEFYCNVDAY